MSLELEFINELSNVLVKIQDLAHQILEIEDQKYDAIKSMEIDQLISLNDTESSILAQIEGLENKRKDIIETLSLKFAFDTNLPIRVIINYFPDKYAKSILDNCLDIKNICNKINIATERNAYILNSNLEIVCQILELIQGTSSSQYNYQGLTEDTKKQNIYMLDQLI